jgi:hypothetical protein
MGTPLLNALQSKMGDHDALDKRINDAQGAIYDTGAVGQPADVNTEGMNVQQKSALLNTLQQRAKSYDDNAP